MLKNAGSNVPLLPSIVAESASGDESQVSTRDLRVIDSEANITLDKGDEPKDQEETTQPLSQRTRALSISKQAFKKAVLISSLSRTLTINFDASKEDVNEIDPEEKDKSTNTKQELTSSAFNVGVTSSILVDGFQLQYSARNPENILYSTFYFKHGVPVPPIYDETIFTDSRKAAKNNAENNPDAARRKSRLPNDPGNPNKKQDNTANSSGSLDKLTGFQRKDSNPTDPIFIALTHDAHKLSVYDTSIKLPKASHQSVPGNNLISAKVIESPDSVFIKKGIRAIIHISKFNFFLASGESVGLDAFNTRFEWISSFVTPDMVLNMKYIENSDCVVTSDASNITVWAISCVPSK